MTTAYAVLTFVFGLGAFIGICAALFAEVGRILALRDGSIDAHERMYLRRLGFGLWTSVLLLVISNPLIAYLEYQGAGSVQDVFQASFWFDNTLILFILLDLWLMARRYLPLWFGGAVSLTSYGFIALLFFFGADGFSYFGLLILYAVGIFVVGGILEYAHILTRTYEPTDSTTEVTS